MYCQTQTQTQTQTHIRELANAASIGCCTGATGASLLRGCAGSLCFCR